MANSQSHGRASSARGFTALRPIVLSLGKLLGLGISLLPSLKAAPTSWNDLNALENKPKPKPPNDPELWVYLGVAVVLVLLGGIFAGLTIALMGQDDVNLQVIHESGDGKEKTHAGSVLRLLKRGKHWVLVTLLLSNVITNETLPIVLDRSLGGGWPAVLGSTALIVIFGEIIPQSICVRYGLPIGAWMAPLVLGLMWVLAPIAWPTAKLLDYLLGEDRGNIYKKAGLKTLVTLHKTLGTSASERLNQDEVTIISAVLDLKDKAVGSIMTPMEDTFTLSADTILDEKMMDTVLSAGYSRIPIHAPDNEQNFIGMLLVKTLITYDPEDGAKVSDFALATLPETRPETSCLDIVNFFQEGKSHMVLVSESPGEDHGALGVVTLEDVIEELIGEEIIDESDVYVDVHKAVRRKTPAPRARIAAIHSTTEDHHVVSNQELLIEVDEEDAANVDGTDDSSSKEQRRRDSQPDTGAANNTSGRSKNLRSLRDNVLRKGSAADLRSQAKHYGPLNLASRPLQTRYNSVKIKPGSQPSEDGGMNVARRPSEGTNRTQSGTSELSERGGNRSETSTPFVNAAGKQASDAVQALQDYNTVVTPPRASSSRGGGGGGDGHRTSSVNKGIQATSQSDVPQSSPETIKQSARTKDDRGSTSSSSSSSSSESTLGPLPNRSSRSARKTISTTRGNVRSGSITENVIEAGGVRKVVLETTSSSEEAEAESSSGNNSNKHEKENRRTTNGTEKAEDEEEKDDDDEEKGEEKDDGGPNGGGEDKGGKKKRRRKRRKGGAVGEETPLLRG